MKLRSDNPRHHQPLPWLVLVSLVLHAGLLAWQVPQPHEVPALSSRNGTLAIQLTAPHPSARQPASSSRRDAGDAQPAATAAADSAPQPSRIPDAPVAATQSPAPEPVTETRTARTEPEPQPSTERPERTRAARPTDPEPRQTLRTAATDATAQPVETRAGTQGSAVLEEIRDALQRHFFYPRLARLRNWEGNVLLGFQVHSDGRIEDIQVLESSGRAVLDQAAMRALRSVQQVAWNATRPVDLQLPVAYRLH